MTDRKFTDAQTADLMELDLLALFTPGGVHELRIPKAGGQRTISGYFDNPAGLAQAAARLDPAGYAGIYFTANPCLTALLARCANQYRGHAETTTADHNIAARRWLIIDLDPVRPAGIPSTDVEHQAATDRARTIHTHLAGRGWPTPVAMDSGNGAYLLYRVDLANDDNSRDLIKACLAALATKFDDGVVTVDQTMFNAARIIRVPGTTNRKGSGSPDRPHRVARILACPEPVDVVPAELLAGLAATVEPAPAPVAGRSPAVVRPATSDGYDLEGFLAKHFPDARKKSGQQTWVFRVCPFNDEHTGTEAAIGRAPRGGIWAGCQHASCTWEWADLRARYDPKPVRPANELGKPAGKRGGRGSDEPTIPELLVMMANTHYEVFLGADGEPYAAERRGPCVALPLRGRSGLRQRLANMLFDARGKVPSGEASGAALLVLEGQALDKPRRDISLRAARSDDNLFVDMGRPDGQIIEVSPDGWRIVNRAPTLYRRTALTGAMPDPDPAGTLDAFQAGLNMSEENFHLVVGWMLHAFIPDEPHPVLGLIGEQGTAKTTAAKQIAGIVDPSPAPTRTAPKDLTDWAVTASGSWLVTLDNISEIRPWFSDALCKAVTGDAMTKRTLYTDGDLSVLVFLRPVIMTSIDAGVLRGDLAERLLPIELDRIPQARRRTDRDVRSAYEQHQAQTLGAMLSLLCQVLKVLPDVQVGGLPRMADFARFLAALDQVTGWNTLSDYRETFGDLADVVISGDPFAAAIRAKAEAACRPGEVFNGTATALLCWVKPQGSAADVPLPRGWPKTPHGAAGQLKRIIPALLQHGINVEFYREGKERTRKIKISRVAVPERQADAADAADGLFQKLYPPLRIGNSGNNGADQAGETFQITASAASAASATPLDQGKQADAPADALRPPSVRPASAASAPLPDWAAELYDREAW